MLMGSPTTAQAAATTFIVNSTNDVDDGTCDATHCSLREAINAANANSGTDTIAFNISGAGPHTIQPASALPTITDPVIIDGYTQPGASPNTNGPGLGLNTVLKIELDGTDAGAFIHGLDITAGSSTVRGLVINRFGIDSHGISLHTNGGNVIEGNFIGTDVTGSVDLGNGQDGVNIGFAAPNNIIGGTTSNARNLISGNTNGVSISGSGATGNVVQGNLIGTDVTGTVALGNLRGIWVSSALNTIGGTTPGARNVISGNTGSSIFSRGIRIYGAAATGNKVQGNFIGTDVTGTGDLGNLIDGVAISNGANNNAIGGTATAAGNIIAFNGGDGVFVETGTGNAILGNSIFSNDGLGIDLGSDGITPNDAGDGDAGANGLQNFPVVTSAVAGSTTVEVTLNSTPNTIFRLELFSNSSCDASGNGEGAKFIGVSSDVTTDETGNHTVTINLLTTVPVGHFITATVTDPNNNTSEFSACQAVAPAPTPTPTPVPGITLPGLAAMAGMLVLVLVWTLRRKGLPTSTP
jgi:CSLREA domain-containing protein